MRQASRKTAARRGGGLCGNGVVREARGIGFVRVSCRRRRIVNGHARQSVVSVQRIRWQGDAGPYQGGGPETVCVVRRIRSQTDTAERRTGLTLHKLRPVTLLVSAPIPQDSATGFLYIEGRRMGTSRYELVYTPDSEEEDTVSDGFCVTVFDVEDVRRIVGE